MGAMNIKYSNSDKLFYFISYFIITFAFLIVLLPMINIVASSFSSPQATTSGKVTFWPIEPSLLGYKTIFQWKAIWTGYRNSAYYMILGTIINVIITLICAYPLSRLTLPGHRFISLFFVFTMFFSGGIIPNYILVRNLNMINTVWAMIIPGAMSVYNMIITRTYIRTSIPFDLLEASQIDGCSDLRYFWSIVIPLSKPVVAVITLFYAVEHWNSYFTAFLYITQNHRYPLQLVLRQILILSSIDTSAFVNPDAIEASQYMANLVKYGLIIVASLPMMVLYPFIQKHFIKGIMIGSLKG